MQQTIATRTLSFQERVVAWFVQCFDISIRCDVRERGDRLLEEVLELLQSHGYDRTRVATLVDYVYGRKVGDPPQEVGGVMVTLAAYCHTTGLNMHECGETELNRIWMKIPEIRAKQASKRGLHTPLPMLQEMANILAAEEANGGEAVPLLPFGVTAADLDNAPQVVSDHVRKLVSNLAKWRPCMSYNDSYFGEPAGLVKATVGELERAVNPPRFHSGGVVGLQPGEVPAILSRGYDIPVEVDPRQPPAMHTQDNTSLQPWCGAETDDGICILEKGHAEDHDFTPKNLTDPYARIAGHVYSGNPIKPVDVAAAMSAPYGASAMQQARYEVEEAYKRGEPIECYSMNDPLSPWHDAARFLKNCNGRFEWGDYDYRVKK